jgi:hypothetical protein
MRLFCYLFAAVFGIVSGAAAQSFSGSSGIVATPVQQPTVQPAKAVTAPAAEDTQNADDESGNMLQDAVVKLDSEKKTEEPEPAYDNTHGKVKTFKMVKGKIVLDESAERKILVSYSDFKVSKGMDNMVRCSMRIYVLNDLTERINSFAFKLIWPDIDTSIQLVKVNPGVNTYRDIMLLGDGCFSMDKNPTIEVNRCRVKGMSEEKCANAVKWFRRAQ